LFVDIAAVVEFTGTAKKEKKKLTTERDKKRERLPCVGPSEGEVVGEVEEVEGEVEEVEREVPVEEGGEVGRGVGVLGFGTGPV
jgi:hypothetical protein